MPERDIESLGVMGKGAGGGQEILPLPPSSLPPPSPPIKYENPKSSYFFFEKALVCCGHTVNNANNKSKKLEISDLDLRIARIDPSRQVSMDEPPENENELTRIVNIVF